MRQIMILMLAVVLATSAVLAEPKPAPKARPGSRVLTRKAAPAPAVRPLARPLTRSTPTTAAPRRVIGASADDQSALRHQQQMALEHQRYHAARDLQRDRDWAAYWRQQAQLDDNERARQWEYTDRASEREAKYSDRSEERAYEYGDHDAERTHRERMLCLQKGIPLSTVSPATPFCPPAPPIPAELGGKTTTSALRFETFETAKADFRQRYGERFRNYFTAQPATWPSWIPKECDLDGTTVRVIYNNVHAEFGVLVGEDWLAYDFWADEKGVIEEMKAMGYSCPWPE